MAALAPRLEAADIGGGAYVVSVTGSIEGDDAVLLADIVIPLATDGSDLILDLRDAHHLDERAASSLVAAAEIARTHDGSLCLVGSPLPLQRLLGAWVVDEHFASTASLDDAVSRNG
jgi:anti-anti-sigma regulatory factor